MRQLISYKHKLNFTVIIDLFIDIHIYNDNNYGSN